MKNKKEVILFLVKFFVVYFSLTAGYSFYLNKNQVTEGVFSCAPITKMVTEQSEFVTELFGYDVYIDQNYQELSMMFMVNESYVVKIVEGCSSISIIVLFLAFIISFKGRWYHTIWYAIIGVILIYVVNILRIVLLALAIYHFPEYQAVLHNIVFPSIIYGMVFLLWVIWVRQFSIIGKNND